MLSQPLITPHMRAFAAAVLLAFVACVIHLVRYHRLSLRESLLWLLSTLIALVFTVFPDLLRGIADVLQITIASNALFALAFVYVLLNLLALTVGLSGQTARMRRLTQECALLRAQLEELRSSQPVRTAEAVPPAPVAAIPSPPGLNLAGRAAAGGRSHGED